MAWRVDRRLEAVVAALAARVAVVLMRRDAAGSVLEHKASAVSMYMFAKKDTKSAVASVLHDASKPCSQSQKKLKVGYRDRGSRQF